MQGIPAWQGAPLLAGGGPASSEDCLLLDVMVPSQPASSNLPVMVQIHGGGKIFHPALALYYY